MVRPRNVLMAWDSSVSSCAASDALKRYNGDLEAAKRYLAAKNMKKPSTKVAVRPRNILMAWDSSVSSHAASDALKRVNGDLGAAKRYLTAKYIEKQSAEVVVSAADTTTICERCDRDLGTNDQLKTLDCCHQQFCTNCYDMTDFTDDQCCGTEVCDSCVDESKICEGCDQLWCEMKTFDCCQEERCHNCYDNTNFTEDQCCGTEICDSCVDESKICEGCNQLWCNMETFDCCDEERCQNCYDNTNFTEDQCCGTGICDSCVDENKICEGCNQLWCNMKTFDCCDEERCQNCYAMTNFTEDQCCGTEICDSCVAANKYKICDGCYTLWCQDGQFTLDEASGTYLCQNCTDTKSSANDNAGDEDNMTEGNPRKRKM